MKSEKNYAKSFLGRYLAEERYRSNRRSPAEKNSIIHDKWDREDFDAVIREIDELPPSIESLKDITHTAPAAMGDAFFSMMKAFVDVKDPSDIRPSHLVNRAVMGEMLELQEYERLRLHSVGDIVTAGLSTVEIEPTLESIFDKNKKAQELADQLEQQMEELEGLADQQEGNGNNPTTQQAMEKLIEAMGRTAEQLDQSLRESAPEMRDKLRKSLEEMAENAENTEDFSATWGLGEGGLKRLPPKQRLELAKRLNTEKFKRMAKLFGAMMRMAIAEQQKKTKYARNEIHNITLGNDLGKVLPSEILLLGDPDGELLFFEKFVEQQLMQYDLRGTERIAKGGIIFCEDGSGSMAGDREIWAKAVGLALLKIAQKQKRDFYGIHFGSTGEYMTFDFHKTGGADVQKYSTKTVTEPQSYDPIEAVLFFAETFFNGGTCFMTPLSAALDRLQAEYDRTGAVSGDIVFVTDGECSVHDDWLKEFKAKQNQLGFRVWGIYIGGVSNVQKVEPLYTICDGRLISIKEVQSGADIKGIFREI